jgi:hypothetical protein
MLQVFPPAQIVQAPPGALQSRLGSSHAKKWISGLAGKRGMLVLVGYAPGWNARLDDPFFLEVEEELAVVYVSPQDPLLGRLGIQAPGAHLLGESGKALGGWTAGVPQDLRRAFAELGWKSMEEELREFLRAHPDRLDVRWRLVQKAWLRAVRRRTLTHFQDLAGLLEDFFKQEGWAQLPARGLPALLPSEARRPTGPLADLAQGRIEVVRDALRRDPEAPLAWEMLAFLSSWKDDPEPRLSTFIADLEAPPQLFRTLGAWPLDLALKLAEAQLRRQADWAGMEVFATGRRELLERHILKSAPELPAAWAAKLGESRFNEMRSAFLQEACLAIGRWHLLELEAQLEQGHFGAAETTASHILGDGERATISAALSLARRFRAESIVKSLEM